MKFEQKWIKVLALSMGLPGTILGLFLVIQAIINKGLISKTLGTILGVVIVSGIILQIVIIAFHGKNKS